MLKLTVVDIFLRTIPEAFLFIMSAYLFSFKKVDKERFIISILIFSTCTYLVRELPIHYGVHIIINMIAYALIMVFINKIDAIKAVTYSLGFMMLLSICEWLNLLLLNILIKGNLQKILQNSFTKNLYFAPSLVLFVIIVLSIRFMIKKKEVCI